MFRAPFPWEKEEAEEVPLNCGFPEATPADKGYVLGHILGKGGFGSVFSVKRSATGVEFACKTIEKRLDVPNLPPVKQEQHLNNIKREVAILTRLRAALNVVHLEEVFEDEKNVFVVMQQCSGGELLAGIGKRHYSERTVASYMRAVLRTLSQCHHHKILHRDIKPGNFMLLHNAEDSPVLAIDFGLAVFYDPKNLPVRDLGLEGTPHYMAPECLSSEVYPASDVWAAGVMAYQLLSAQFPFDDWKNTRSPALSQLWKSILTEEPKLNGSSWNEVSDGAKDFVRKLLVKDPKQRMSAQQALEHPWIQGKKQQRTEGKPLAGTIVQRLQRFGTESAFKRTVLDMIANDLLQRHVANMQHSHSQPQPQQQQKQRLASPLGRPGSNEGSLRLRTSGLGALNSQNNLRALAAAFRERSTHNGNQSGLNPDKSHTVHASSEAVAILKPRKASNVQQAVPGFRHASVGHHLNHLDLDSETEEGAGIGSRPSGFTVGSIDSVALHNAGHNKWSRMFDEMQERRRKQQKIQRLMLDTSGRGQSNFFKTCSGAAPAPKGPLEAVREGVPVGASTDSDINVDRAGGGWKTAGQQLEHEECPLERHSIFAEFEAQHAQAELKQPSDQQPHEGPPAEEEGRRGRGAFAALFGKAAAPFAGAHKQHQHPQKSSKPAQQSHDMPSIRTVKGAHQLRAGPQLSVDPATFQQQQEQKKQAAGELSAQEQLQEGSGHRLYPLLASGLGHTTFDEGPSSTAEANLPVAIDVGQSGQGTSQQAPIAAAAAPPTCMKAPAQPTPASLPQAAAPAPSQHGIAEQLARLQGSGDGGSVQPGKGRFEDGKSEGTVLKGALFSVLGKLMGGPTQLAELQSVLERLHYGEDQDQVSFSQVSEGLQKLGYKLQPLEVEALLREVSVGGDNVSQSAFLASQVDWREFQRNHREEWLCCLRNAFQGLDKNNDGRICADEILAILKDKLPEEEVNLAVQETLTDAAVMSEEGMSFDDFQALFQSDSVADLGAYESGRVDGSVHGANMSSISRQSSGEAPPGSTPSPEHSGYHPKLETVVDTGA